MTEIISPSGIGTAIGAKLVYDVCGPTAQYLGGELAAATTLGVNNLKRVFKHAAECLKLRRNSEGQVPPRVLKNILNEGYFCEDELGAAYLGGILASSKGPVTRDDRAVAHCAVVASLSSYQIRTHYLLYSSILRATPELIELRASLSDFVKWVRRGTGGTVVIRETDYLRAMEFSETEPAAIIAEQTFVGLQQKGLCENGHAVAHPNPAIKRQPSEDFRWFHPTLFGIELFMWGIGMGKLGIDAYAPDCLRESLPPTIQPLHLDLSRTMYS